MLIHPHLDHSVEVFFYIDPENPLSLDIWRFPEIPPKIIHVKIVGFSMVHTPSGHVLGVPRLRGLEWQCDFRPGLQLPATRQGSPHRWSAKPRSVAPGHGLLHLLPPYWNPCFSEGRQNSIVGAYCPGMKHGVLENGPLKW